MDIGQLRTVLHVAELGSVTTAAARLGIAQPALSRQIRLLELELGGQIFTRHGRGMKLTELGHKIIGPASDILMRLDAIRRLGSTSSQSLLGKVRVGMTPTVSEIATLPLVEAIRTTQPGLSLSFTAAFSGHLLEWLKRGELDCCFTYDVPTNGLVRTVPVLDEPLFLVMLSDSLSQPTNPLNFAELQSRSLILPSPLHGLRKILDVAAMKAGIELTTTIEVDSLSAIIDLVRAGLGATILPYAPIHQLVLTGELVAINLVDPTPSRRVVMAYAMDRSISPATPFIGQVFAEVIEKLVVTGEWNGNIVRQPHTDMPTYEPQR